MEILIPLSLFAMIAALVIVPRYFKSIERQKMAETVRVAIEKGQPLPNELIDALSSNVRTPGLPPSPQRDLRTGIIWIGVAVGLAVMGVVVGVEEPDATYPMLGIAAFPATAALAEWRAAPATSRSRWARRLGGVGGKRQEQGGGEDREPAGENHGNQSISSNISKRVRCSGL